MTEPRVYFSHNKLTYSSPAKYRQVRFLRANLPGCRVIDPQADLPDVDPMAAALAAVEQADLVVVVEYQRHVGRGCFQEVEHAIQLGIPVLALAEQEGTPGHFAVLKVASVSQDEINNWRINYGRLVTTGDPLDAAAVLIEWAERHASADTVARALTSIVEGNMPNDLPPPDYFDDHPPEVF
jgi:hypothetical protein